jgi:hypothetical protein
MQARDEFNLGKSPRTNLRSQLSVAATAEDVSLLKPLLTAQDFFLSPPNYDEAGSRNSQRYGSSEQSSGKKGELLSEVHESPVKQRFFLALAALFGCFFFSLWGWMNIYNNRRRLGGLLISIGALTGSAGMGLLWLSRFPATWGWLL